MIRFIDYQLYCRPDNHKSYDLVVRCDINGVPHDIYNCINSTEINRFVGGADNHIKCEIEKIVGNLKDEYINKPLEEWSGFDNLCP